MTDLERRALLGDREAQEECTRQGIVLPCPFCGKTPKVKFRDTISSYGVVCDCGVCGHQFCETEEYAIRTWNTFVAPPLGRCGTCKWAGENIEHPSDPHIFCDQFERILLKDDFCSLYEEADNGQE